MRTQHTFSTLFLVQEENKKIINLIKVNSYFTISFIVAFILITEKIFNNNNLFSENDFGDYWYALTLGIIIQILFAKWMLIKYTKANQ